MIKMTVKEPNEKRSRQKLLRALKQKVDGKPTRLKQSELNYVVGKASVRAAFLKDLLHRMKDEQLIDYHHWQTNTTRKRSCMYWAVYKHPENVIARERRRKAEEKCDEESEVIGMSISEYAQRVQEQSAIRRAKEKFHKDLERYFAHNYDENFDVIRRIYRDYTPRTRWLYSRQWLETTRSERERR